jgi:hypothetical protein
MSDISGVLISKECLFVLLCLGLLIGQHMAGLLMTCIDNLDESFSFRITAHRNSASFVCLRELNQSLEGTFDLEHLQG